MSIEFGLTDGPVNTGYAPLAALSVYYQQNLIFDPLFDVGFPFRAREFTFCDKMTQVLLSILAGCRTLSEVNTRLRPEVALAKVWHWERFADQSNLSRALDRLTLTEIDQMGVAVTRIWRAHSMTTSHDWRGYLWLDFDLSGLPCGQGAEASAKGYFSGKKTPPDAN